MSSRKVCVHGGQRHFAQGREAFRRAGGEKTRGVVAVPSWKPVQTPQDRPTFAIALQDMVGLAPAYVGSLQFDTLAASFLC